jgi:hypothetical protein
LSQTSFLEVKLASLIDLLLSDVGKSFWIPRGIVPVSGDGFGQNSIGEIEFDLRIVMVMKSNGVSH